MKKLILLVFALAICVTATAPTNDIPGCSGFPGNCYVDKFGNCICG